MTIEAEAKKIVDTYQAAQKAALDSLGEGKPFLGAFGVADFLGLERDTPEWNTAVSAAYNEFKHRQIIVNADNVQVAA